MLSDIVCLLANDHRISDDNKSLGLFIGEALFEVAQT